MSPCNSIKARFGNVGTPAQRQHLLDLIRVKHLAFAESSAECKQNSVVLCDPILTSDPPDTVRRSTTQALSPPQKEFLHKQVRELIDNGFLVRIDEDKVRWISETRIAPKPSAEINSNVSIRELQLRVNDALKQANLDHDPSLPAPTPNEKTSVDKQEQRYRLVHN
jgi:hypothetical protein